MPRSSQTRSSPVIVAMLLASLALTAVLAWQAQKAATSQRQLAEQVLIDYSSLIADEFVRRATAQLGYYGYYNLVGQLQAFNRENTSPPSMADLQNGQTRHASFLASGIVFYDKKTDALHSQASMDPEMSSRILDALQDMDMAAEDMQPFAIMTVTRNNRYWSYVVAPGSRGQEFIAFEVNRDAMGDWLQPVFEQSQLLPASLVGDEFSNDDLYLSLADPDGHDIFKSGGRYDPAMLVRRSLGDDYQGILKDYQLIAGIDPSVASKLVIGGLPQSRLPIILILLLLAVAMVVAAIRQLRRERELMQMRSDFVAQVSHELRTPLTQIRMFAETLLFNRVRSDDDRQRALEIINRESQRLAHLVENVLQFSRGERDQIQLDMHDRAVVPLIEELVREFEPLSGSHSIGVDCMIGRGSTVRADDGALRQIMLNLLDNAIKYGPARQHIRIALERRGSKVIVAVEDQGPGIPADDREKIWGGYYRLPREQSRAIAGTGIGLAVVRELVTLHGGRCWVEDCSAGGARFIVELPLTEGDRKSQTGAGSTIESTGVTE